MIYSYSKAVKIGEKELNKKVFICCNDIEPITTAGAILMQKNFEKLCGTHNLKIAIFPDNSVPLITIDDSEKTADISAIANMVFSKIDSFGGDSDSEIAIKFMQNLVVVVTKTLKGDKKLAEILVASCKMQYEWEHKGKLQKAFTVAASDVDSDLRSETMEALNMLNEEFTNAFASLDIKDNETVFQEDCTSKLFIEIPTMQDLMTDDVDITSLLPEYDELCKPYSDSIASTPKYKKVYADNKTILHDIEGDRSHNTMQLYDNEKDYFNALDKWVQYNMREQYGTVDGNVIDSISQEYLTELITRLYMLHWRHSVNVPDYIDDSEDDSQGISSRYGFINKETRMNAVILLEEFLKEASAEYGYKVYIYTVIQIARWGSRKPTAIVFDDYRDEFDLGIGISRKKIGDVSAYKVIKSHGCESKIIGVIVEDKQVRDKSLEITYSSLPIGVILNTELAPSEDSPADEHVNILMYYHFVDLIPEVKGGTLKVDGITWDGTEWMIDDSAPDFGQISVTELINSYENSKNSILRFPFYRSPALIDMLSRTRRSTIGVQQSLFTIFNMRVADPDLRVHAGQAKFSNYNQILNIVADQSNTLNSAPSIIEYGIMQNLLPVIREVAESNPESTAEIFSVWDKALENYAGLPSLSGEERPQAVQQVQQATAFNASVGKESAVVPEKKAAEVKSESNTEVAAPKPVVDTSLDDWYKIIPDDAVLVPVVLENGNTVGYVYTEKVVNNNTGRGFLRYTVAGKKESYAVTTDQTISFYKVMACMLHTISLRKSGSTTRQVYFADAQALDVFKKNVMRVAKGEPVVL